jgi:hypothetical protein
VLITQRSQVQILPPLLRRRPRIPGPSFIGEDHRPTPDIRECPSHVRQPRAVSGLYAPTASARGGPGTARLWSDGEPSAPSFLPICACFAAGRQGAWISTVVVPETPWEDGDGVTQLAVVRSTALHDSSVFIAVEDHGGNGHVHDEGRRNSSGQQEATTPAARSSIKESSDRSNPLRLGRRQSDSAAPRHVSVFRTCDDDDMPRWIRSYWDEEQLAFVGEVSDDGWITRHVEVGGSRPSLAGWLAAA